MISAPGEGTQDSQRWWQAYLLAENDQADELRERATAGDDHARWQLATWLAERLRESHGEPMSRTLMDVARAFSAGSAEACGTSDGRWLTLG